MTRPVLRQAIDVVLGDPQRVADRIEAAFGEHDVAAVCHVEETIVKVDVSTLALESGRAGEHVRAWIEQAAVDVAARIQWLDAS